MCTKSQKDGQNHKYTGVKRAFFHKCPSRRASPSLDGRLLYTGDDYDEDDLHFALLVVGEEEPGPGVWWPVTPD